MKVLSGSYVLISSSDETAHLVLPFVRRALAGAKKINVVQNPAEGGQYTNWWQASLVPPDVDDSHDLRSAHRLCVAGGTAGLRTLADGLFALAPMVLERGLGEDLEIPSPWQDRGVAIHRLDPPHAVVDGKGAWSGHP
jgi:hypothetical protein